MTLASIVVQPIDHLVLTLFGFALIVGAAPYEQFKARSKPRWFPND